MTTLISVLVRLPRAKHAARTMIPAIVRGQWALHRFVGFRDGTQPRWLEITHIPTGLNINLQARRGDATRRLLRQLDIIPACETQDDLRPFFPFIRALALRDHVAPAAKEPS